MSYAQIAKCLPNCMEWLKWRRKKLRSPLKRLVVLYKTQPFDNWDFKLTWRPWTFITLKLMILLSIENFWVLFIHSLLPLSDSPRPQMDSFSELFGILPHVLHREGKCSDESVSPFSNKAFDWSDPTIIAVSIKKCDLSSLLFKEVSFFYLFNTKSF